jgi:hypothetical protein
MRNFFLIKHHLPGLLGVYQENPRQKRDLPDTRTVPCPFSVLAGRHDGDVICLRRRAVNIQHSSMQSAYSTSNLPPLRGAWSGADNPSSRYQSSRFCLSTRGRVGPYKDRKALLSEPVAASCEDEQRCLCSTVGFCDSALLPQHTTCGLHGSAKSCAT